MSQSASKHHTSLILWEIVDNLCIGIREVIVTEVRRFFFCQREGIKARNKDLMWFQLFLLMKRKLSTVMCLYIGTHTNTVKSVFKASSHKQNPVLKGQNFISQSIKVFCRARLQWVRHSCNYMYFSLVYVCVLCMRALCAHPDSSGP